MRYNQKDFPEKFIYRGGDFPFDLQRHADDDPPKDEPKVEWIDFTDPQTNKQVKIPKGVDVLIGHISARARKEAEEKYKPLLDAADAEKADFVSVKAELEKIKEASMTAEQKAQADAQKVIREHEAKAKKAVDEAENWRSRFVKSTIRNDILSSFGDAKLCNPSQVALLLEQEGKARIEEKVGDDGKPTGEFETRITLELVNDKGDIEIVEGTPQSLFKKWIDQDRNLHHQAVTMNPGGGSNGNNGRGAGKQDLSKLKPSDRLNAAFEQGSGR